VASSEVCATHALLIVLDRLRPDSLPLVSTPHIDALIARGASSMRAQVTMPSVTLMSLLWPLDIDLPVEWHGRIVRQASASAGQSAGRFPLAPWEAPS
jgi:hypothetical protein